MAHQEDERRQLGERLASARNAAGLTLDAVAQALTERGYQITRGAINAWESGRNAPDSLWLRRVAKLYQTSTDALVGDSGAAWPFRRVAVGRVLALEPDDLSYAEGALAKALDDIDGPPNPEDLERFDAAHGRRAKKSAKRKSA